MFSRMRRALAALRRAVMLAVAAPQLARRLQEQLEAQARPTLEALAQQAQAAATVRQLVLVAQLGRHLLPVRLQPLLLAVLEARLAALPTRSPGSPRNTASRRKTARSTTRHRARR